MQRKYNLVKTIMNEYLYGPEDTDSENDDYDDYDLDLRTYIKYYDNGIYYDYNTYYDIVDNVVEYIDEFDNDNYDLLRLGYDIIDKYDFDFSQPWWY